MTRRSFFSLLSLTVLSMLFLSLIGCGGGGREEYNEDTRAQQLTR